MFYGWRIVGVTFATHFVSVGFIFYSGGVFLKPLVEELEGSRLLISLGAPLGLMVQGALGPLLGRALDEGYAKTVLSAGAVFMGVGFLVASQVQALWQFYLVLASLMSVGAAMMGNVPNSTLVANWFVRKRGLAIGLAAVGISLSGMVMAPVATLLVAEWGWRGTFMIYGVAAMVIVLPLVQAIVINRPEDLGQSPDGDATPLPEGFSVLAPVVPVSAGDANMDRPLPREWSALGAMNDRNFWVISLVIALNFFGLSAVLYHIIPHATDIGFTPQQAAFLLSVMAGFGVMGKIFFGWIADRVDIRLGGWLLTVLQFAGLVVIMRTREYNYLLGAAFFFGFGMGGVVSIHGALVGAAFGRNIFGRVMGLMNPVMLPVHMLGIPFAAHVFDTRGNYTLAFQTFLVTYLLAIVALAFLRMPDTSERRGESTVDRNDGTREVATGS